MNRLAVVGAGSWGTALSVVLAHRFESVSLWAHDPQLASEISTARENRSYLPGVSLPANIHPTGSLAEALDRPDIVLLVVPSQFLREVLRQAKPHLTGDPLYVSATKGLEKHSLLLMSEVIDSEIAGARVGVLSGPTFAREIAEKWPAAVVICSADPYLASCVQSAFSTPRFRLYTNSDVIGVQIGAALKNVIAIAAGVCNGMQLGSNAIAALITRGLAEISRLALALGADPRTLAGLTGLGDLVLTCTGELSRNRRVGMELAKGRKLPEILASTNTIAEGVETTEAAVELARRHQVEMPITEQMYEILNRGKDPREGVRELMVRALKSE